MKATLRFLTALAVLMSVATACEDWRWATPNAEDLTGLAISGGRLWAIGGNGAVLDQEDGEEWSENYSGTGHDLLAIAPSGDGALVVGDFASWASSADGESWSSGLVPGDRTLSDVVFGPDRFVARGDGAEILSTVDGTSWSVTPLAGAVNDLIWTGQRLVAVGDGGLVAVSLDAQNWTTSVVDGADRDVVAAGDPGLLSIGDEVVWSSVDGLTWNLVAVHPTLAGITHLVHASGRWVAVVGGGVTPGSSNSRIVSSQNGVLWTVEAEPGFEVRGLTADGTTAWLAGGARILRREVSGEWVDHRDGRSGLPPDLSLDCSGSGCVAVRGGNILTSRHGLEWENVPTTTDELVLSDVVGHAFDYVAVGAGGLVVRGGRQLALTEGSGAGVDLVAVDRHAGLVAAVGSDVLVRGDENGWRSDQLPFQAASVAVGPASQVVAVGEGSFATFGPGGAASAAVLERNERFVQVVAGLDSYLAVARNDQRRVRIFLESVDGRTWSRLSETRWLAGQTFWSGSQWIDHGIVIDLFGLGLDGFVVRTSVDGRSWTERKVEVGLVVSDLAFTGKRLVAVGSAHGGGIATSVCPPEPKEVTARPILVPAVARGAGRDGVPYRSDVVVHNPASADAVVTVHPIPAWLAPSFWFDVPAGQSVGLTDVLGRSGADVGSGAIEIRASERLLVDSVTWRPAPDGGRLGQRIPGRTWVGDADRRRIVQLGGGVRNSIGLVNPSENLVRARLVQLDGAGTQLSDRVVEVASRTLFRPVDTTEGLISSRLELTPVSGPLPEAWVSLVSADGDGVFLDPQPISADPLWIPAITHAQGAEGTEWRTDVEFDNPSQDPVLVDLEFYPRTSMPASGPAVVVRRGLGAGDARRFPDAVVALFQAEGAGALRVVPVAGEVRVSSRTHSRNRGQYVAAIPESDALTPGETATILGLDGRPGFRSNLGLTNVDESWITVEVTVKAADGRVLRGLLVDLPPFANILLPDVLAGAGVPLAFAEVRSDSWFAAYLAWAAVVDDASGDSVFVPARRTPAGAQ